MSATEKVSVALKPVVRALFNGGEVIVMPLAYSDGRILRLNVTTKGGFELSVNGIVNVAVSIIAVCLSASVTGIDGPTPVALPFVVSRVHDETLIVVAAAFAEPSYASDAATVALSISAIGIPAYPGGTGAIRCGLGALICTRVTLT